MNTIEILNKAHQDPVLRNTFEGVFAVDKISKITRYPTSLIVSLDKSNSPGSHWVALHFTKDRKCEYFDSYGRKPTKPILEYIAEYAKSYTYNNVCVQDLWTVSCGQMCLYFLIWRSKSISFKQIIESMRSDEFIEGFIDSL